MQMSVSRREVGKSLRAVFQRMENNPLAVLLFRRRAAHRTILQCYNYHTTVKRKNVVKKRVTLAIAFAVFIVVVIAVILLIKPVMSKVQENRTAKVSQETAQEAEEFLKTKYPEVVIEKREMYVKEHKPQENTQYISSKSIDTEYSYASYVFYGTMDTPDAKGDSVIIYMSDSGKSPYYAVKDSTDKDDAKWQMSIVQNKSGNAKTWDYAFKEK